MPLFWHIIIKIQIFKMWQILWEIVWHWPNMQKIQMRLNTLEKRVNALETLSPQIYMSEDKRLAALKPLERMLELS